MAWSPFVLINAHGENTFFLYEGVDLALRDRPAPSARVLVINWWELIAPATLDDLFAGSFPGWNLEHAAIIETSLMLALAPERVRADQVVDETMAFVPSYAVFPQPEGLVPASGLLSRSTPATAQIGRSLTEIIVAESVRAMAHTFAPSP